MSIFPLPGTPQAGGRQADAQNTQAGFDCLEDGLFEDYDQCDLYWECEGGVARHHLCDDGLVFDRFKAQAGHVDPCDTPLVVDCSERPLMRKYCLSYTHLSGSSSLYLFLQSCISFTGNLRSIQPHSMFSASLELTIHAKLSYNSTKLDNKILRFDRSLPFTFIPQ